MKGLYLYIAPLIILIFCYGISYSADDTKNLQLQQQQAASIQHQQAQNARPILPPVTPSSSAVSPTPSPHIAAPPMSSGPISTPPVNPVPSFPKTPIYNMPSAPVQAATPAMNTAGEALQPNIIGNSIGEVIDIGREKEGSSWIQVRDDIFNETLKIKIDPVRTPVFKKTSVMSFNDIKIGDMVSVIFNQDGENILANFVSILTEEDLKLMQESEEGQPEE